MSTKEFLRRLFTEDEWINICWSSPKQTETIYQISDLTEPVEGKYFCVNPMKKGQSRKQLNLAGRRNFLIEFDELTIKEQWTAIEKYDIPYNTIVFSGNKSLHVIISLDKDIDKAYYRNIAQRMKLVITEADKACFEPARLSRLGCAKQPVKAYGNKITINVLEAWLDSHGQNKEEYEQKAEKFQAAMKRRHGKLNQTTLRLLAGDIPEAEAHRAAISSAKNLQEMDYGKEEIIAMLAGARAHMRPNEPIEEAEAKSKRIVDWVYNEWAHPTWKE